MTRIKNQQYYNRFVKLLSAVPNEFHPFVGLTNHVRRDVLVSQLIDSMRRLEYLSLISIRANSRALYTPYSGSFEPLGGAVALHKEGRSDDAYWLVYLATHFGKHKTDGWNLTEDFYGRFGQGGTWDWSSSSNDPWMISEWLRSIYPNVTNTGRSRRFGNHRKFETLKPGPKGTGYALATYVRWVNRFGSHNALIKDVQSKVGQSPTEVFAHLYDNLNNVAKLGRLGKFDFLCNLSNLKIAPIYPDKSYIAESTGPKAGAKLLFGNSLDNKKLEHVCVKLAVYLDVSPQVIEDALCNWQKSPDQYVYFRG